MIYESETHLLAEAERLTAIWQPLLFLQEWRIKVVLRGLEGKRGKIDWDLMAGGTADLIVCPNYWLGKEKPRLGVATADEWDLEDLIIHELLHLRVEPLVNARKSKQEDEEDRFVSLMARTLKGLRQGQDVVMKINGVAHTFVGSGA